MSIELEIEKRYLTLKDEVLPKLKKYRLQVVEEIQAEFKNVEESDLLYSTCWLEKFSRNDLATKLTNEADFERREYILSTGFAKSNFDRIHEGLDVIKTTLNNFPFEEKIMDIWKEADDFRNDPKNTVAVIEKNLETVKQTLKEVESKIDECRAMILDDIFQNDIYKVGQYASSTKDEMIEFFRSKQQILDSPDCEGYVDITYTISTILKELEKES